ncbi:RNA-binding domain superfamily [Sesbania bispinosa]|nr:RNA-binding domain superfamily [Sesbania bispinosa]
MMRPVFAGNLEYDTRQSELERLFSKYGRIERVDMKSGTTTKGKYAELLSWLANLCANFFLEGNLLACFAFVYYEDERDAEEAIRALDNFPFGYDKRRLSVEWARGERGRHRDGSKANQRPTKTLFVINFDPIRTRFETQEDATKALECTNMSKILDRVVSVEYALRDDGERGDNYGSPRRGGGYERSPSPGTMDQTGGGVLIMAGAGVLNMPGPGVLIMAGLEVLNMVDFAAGRQYEGQELR